MSHKGLMQRMMTASASSIAYPHHQESHNQERFSLIRLSTNRSKVKWIEPWQTQKLTPPLFLNSWPKVARNSLLMAAPIKNLLSFKAAQSMPIAVSIVNAFEKTFAQSWDNGCQLISELCHNDLLPQRLISCNRICTVNSSLTVSRAASNSDQPLILSCLSLLVWD